MKRIDSIASQTIFHAALKSHYDLSLLHVNATYHSSCYRYCASTLKASKQLTRLLYLRCFIWIIRENLRTVSYFTAFTFVAKKKRIKKRKLVKFTNFLILFVLK